VNPEALILVIPFLAGWVWAIGKWQALGGFAYPFLVLVLVWVLEQIGFF
jgi:hypothetical protein